MAADDHGNAYVAGTSFGALPGNTNHGAGDAFVAKYQTNGTLAWVREFGGAGGEDAKAVAAIGTNSVFVAGDTTDSLDGNAHVSGDPLDDLFFEQFDAAGNHLMTKEIGSSAEDEGQDITADSSGDIFVVGWSDGNFDGHTNAGGHDVIALEYTASGTKVWSQEYGTTLNDVATGVVADSAGSMYVLGTTAGSLNGQTSAGGDDIFVMKLNASNGNVIWTKLIGSSGNDESGRIAFAPDGGILVDGSTSDAFTGVDALMAKLDSSGNVKWIAVAPEPGLQRVEAIGVEDGGYSFLLGDTNGPIDNLPMVSGTDYYAIRISPTGQKD